MPLKFSLFHPKKKFTVLVFGPKNAGKSSFIKTLIRDCMNDGVGDFENTPSKTHELGFRLTKFDLNEKVSLIDTNGFSMDRSELSVFRELLEGKSVFEEKVSVVVFVLDLEEIERSAENFDAIDEFVKMSAVLNIEVVFVATKVDQVIKKIEEKEKEKFENIEEIFDVRAYVQFEENISRNYEKRFSNFPVINYTSEDDDESRIEKLKEPIVSFLQNTTLPQLHETFEGEHIFEVHYPPKQPGKCETEIDPSSFVRKYEMQKNEEEEVESPTIPLTNIFFRALLLGEDVFRFFVVRSPSLEPEYLDILGLYDPIGESYFESSFFGSSNLRVSLRNGFSGRGLDEVTSSQYVFYTKDGVPHRFVDELGKETEEGRRSEFVVVYLMGDPEQMYLFRRREFDPPFHGSIVKSISKKKVSGLERLQKRRTQNRRRRRKMYSSSKKCLIRRVLSFDSFGRKEEEVEVGDGNMLDLTRIRFFPKNARFVEIFRKSMKKKLKKWDSYEIEDYREHFLDSEDDALRKRYNVHFSIVYEGDMRTQYYRITHEEEADNKKTDKKKKLKETDEKKKLMEHRFDEYVDAVAFLWKEVLKNKGGKKKGAEFLEREYYDVRRIPLFEISDHLSVEYYQQMSAGSEEETTETTKACFVIDASGLEELEVSLNLLTEFVFFGEEEEKEVPQNFTDLYEILSESHFYPKDLQIPQKQQQQQQEEEEEGEQQQPQIELLNETTSILGQNEMSSYVHIWGRFSPIPEVFPCPAPFLKFLCGYCAHEIEGVSLANGLDYTCAGESLSRQNLCVHKDLHKFTFKYNRQRVAADEEKKELFLRTGICEVGGKLVLLDEITVWKSKYLKLSRSEDFEAAVEKLMIDDVEKCRDEYKEALKNQEGDTGKLRKSFLDACSRKMFQRVEGTL